MTPSRRSRRHPLTELTRSHGNQKSQLSASPSASFSSADAANGMVDRGLVLSVSTPTKQQAQHPQTPKSVRYQYERIEKLFKAGHDKRSSDRSTPNRALHRDQHRPQNQPSLQPHHSNKSAIQFPALADHPRSSHGHSVFDNKLPRRATRNSQSSRSATWKSSDAFVRPEDDPHVTSKVQALDSHEFETNEKTAEYYGPTRKLSNQKSLDLASTQFDFREHNPSLRPFYPLQHDFGVEQRPKTSRGLNHNSAESSQVFFPDADSRADGVLASRRSAFAEGSMTKNSRGIASSWLTIDVPSSEDDSDDEVTPKAVTSQHMSKDDLVGFKPLPATPSTLRKTLHRIRTKSQISGDGASSRGSMSTTSTSSRKTTRRSVPTLAAFNYLGDKIRSLGNFASGTAVDKNISSEKVDQQKGILDERKRKAEEAYAAQFGFKKQKDNFGLASVSQPLPHPSTQCRESTDRPTVRARTNHHSRPVSSRSMLPTCMNDTSFLESIATCNSTVRGVDMLKRPTRTELEKENQQLRALLRESEIRRRMSTERSRSSLSIHSNKSTACLPLDDPADIVELDDHPLLEPHSRERSSASVPASCVTSRRSPSPGKHRSRGNSSASVKQQGADIPPVPALPSHISQRSALAPITGNTVRPTHGNDHDSATRKLLGQGNTPKSSKEVSNCSPLQRRALKPSPGYLAKQQANQTSTMKRYTHGMSLRSPFTAFKDDENSSSGERLTTTAPVCLPGDYQMDEGVSARSVAEPTKHNDPWVWPDDVF